MFETIRAKTHQYVDKHLAELELYCAKDPAIAEMVGYIIAYSDQMAYCGGDRDARIGRQIIQHIWEISKVELSDIANEYHFNPGWAQDLCGFIGNYFIDDSAFDLVIEPSRIKFMPAKYDDDGQSRWLQNPRIITEAAKASVEYTAAVDYVVTEPVAHKAIKFDTTKLMELLGEST